MGYDSERFRGHLAGRHNLIRFRNLFTAHELLPIYSLIWWEDDLSFREPCLP